jgi:hypothetical protein
MRKNVLILVLLFCGAFSLAAQSRSGASIYVPPVTGTGSKPEDNAYFYEKLVYELTNQDFNIAKTQKSADFYLIGALSPYTEGGFSFHLELQDKKGESAVEGELLYKDEEDINSQFPAMVTVLLYTIPDDTGKAPDWRDKWLFLGAGVSWTPRIYTGGDNTLYNIKSIGGGISAEFHPLSFLALGTGLELGSDLVEDIDRSSKLLLEIPLLLKFVVKPGSRFMLEPYGGVQLNIPLYDDTDVTKPPLLTGLAGLQFSVKAGPGAGFLDARFGMDFGKLTVNGGDPSFQRTTIHLTFGYKFGLFQKDSK